MGEQKRQMGLTMANDLDTFVFNKYTDAGKTITNASVTTANIFSVLAEAAGILKPLMFRWRYEVSRSVTGHCH
jgi:hypothetical protein